MNYHNITSDDMLNGSGLRVVLWVSGCEHKCKGCHNAETWCANSGIPFDSLAKDELFELLKSEHIEGITFSGGDPLHTQNRDEIGNLINEIKTLYPAKTIWIYTGYSWDEVKDIPFMKHVNVLVDGKYQAERFDINYPWAGSTNQRVINVKKSLLQDRVVLWND